MKASSPFRQADLERPPEAVLRAAVDKALADLPPALARIAEALSEQIVIGMAPAGFWATLHREDQLVMIRGTIAALQNAHDAVSLREGAPAP